MEKRERFYNIDFLRFIGIIIIIIFHIVLCGMKNYIPTHPNIEHLSIITKNGGRWVEFFFIIAGFFLFYTTDFSIKFIDFFKKKLLRLLPVIIFALCTYKVLSWFDLLIWRKYINIYTLLLINNVGLTARDNMGNIHPTWFVSALFWASMFYYYLKQLLPEKWFNFITTILTFLAYIYTANTTTFAPTVSQNFINTGFLRAIGGIGLGYITYKIYQNQNFLCKNITQKLIVTGLEIYLIVFCIYNTLFHKINFNNYTFFVIIYFFLILLFLYKQGYISQILNNKICTILGRYTYSLFVTHIIVIDLMRNNVWDKHVDFLVNNLGLNIGIVLILSGILGTLTYHFVEQPAAKLLNKLWFKNKSEPLLCPESIKS